MKTAEQIYTDWFGSDSHTTRRSLSKKNVIDAINEGIRQGQPKWIKIESEADLPKENGIYWTLRHGSIVPLYLEIFNDLDRKYWTETYTHYMPIIKPQPPKEE